MLVAKGLQVQDSQDLLCLLVTTMTVSQLDLLS